MDRARTEELLQQLNAAGSVSDLETYADITLKENGCSSFPDYLLEHLRQTDMSPGTLFQKANIQQNYGYQILSGLKNPGRDKVLSLGLALQLSLEDMQRALTLAGKSQLYPRIRRDSILIFSINRKLTVDEANDLLYEMRESPLE